MMDVFCFKHKSKIDLQCSSCRKVVRDSTRSSSDILALGREIDRRKIRLYK
jgi:hypothetical protein